MKIGMSEQMDILPNHPGLERPKSPSINWCQMILLMMRSAFGLGVSIKIGSLNVAEDNSFTALTSSGNSLKGRFFCSKMVVQNGVNLLRSLLRVGTTVSHENVQA
jgi:hypothetical protein